MEASRQTARRKQSQLGEMGEGVHGVDLPPGEEATERGSHLVSHSMQKISGSHSLPNQQDKLLKMKCIPLWRKYR